MICYYPDNMIYLQGTIQIWVIPLKLHFELQKEHNITWDQIRLILLTAEII